MKNLFTIFHFSLFIFLFSLPTLASDSSPESGGRFGQDELNQKLRDGRTLEQRGRFEAALRIYEELYPRYPDDLRLYEALRRVYRRTRNFPKWIQLAQDQRSRHPNQPKFIESLTEAYLKAGEKEKAREVGEEIYRVKPPKEEYFNWIGGLYLTNGMPEEAIRIYRRAREVFHKEDLFAQLLASAYRRTRNDQGAAEEYLRLMKGDQNARRQGENGLRQIMRRGDRRKILSVLKKAIEKEPERKELYPIIGDLHLKEGRYKEALNSYEKGEAGDPLYNLARKAEEEEEYEIALRSYQKLVEKGKSASPQFIPVALYRMGMTLKKMGREDEAIQTFESLMKDHSKMKESSEATYALGQIYLERRRDPDKAAGYFKRFLAKRPQRKEQILEARFYLVECQLQKRDFKKVEKGLLEIANSEFGIRDSRDRALYHLGELYFFQGEFGKSLEVFDRVINEFPKSDYENDALRKIILITDHQSDDGSLKEFARGELLGRQGRYEEGIETLRGIIGSGRRVRLEAPTLVDDAMLLMGDLFERKREYPVAISAYENLVERIPQSNLSPEALRRAGEVYVVKLRDKKRAIETFERVLLDYPNAVQRDLVRIRLEELKEEL